METTRNTDRPEMIFTMGLPGSGKSTTLRNMGLSATHTTIDCDDFKQTHPAYDPKNPGAIHVWSVGCADDMRDAAIASGKGLWISDGTGTHAASMVTNIRAARAAGFYVRLVYVRVSLGTAVARNAARARTVPEAIIHQKAADINRAFDIVSREVDQITIVDND